MRTEPLFEAELERVRAATLRPAVGPFGPGSMMWRVNRESILFAVAGRALLLQLAHPLVAASSDRQFHQVYQPLNHDKCYCTLERPAIARPMPRSPETDALSSRGAGLLGATA